LLFAAGRHGHTSCPWVRLRVRIRARVRVRVRNRLRVRVRARVRETKNTTPNQTTSEIGQTQDEAKDNTTQLQDMTSTRLDNRKTVQPQNKTFGEKIERKVKEETRQDKTREHNITDNAREKHHDEMFTRDKTRQGKTKQNMTRHDVYL
jgi:hypothetical protein